METEELIASFTSALDALFNYNAQLFDFWMVELFDYNDTWKWQNLTVTNLKAIQGDVLYATEDLMLG